MIILIDNYDSFTHNLARYIKRASNTPLSIFKNNLVTIKEIESLKPTHLIISPGPGTPRQSGMSLELINYYQNKIPILGICLGHQAIALHFGANIIQAKKILHGKTSTITHKQDPIFKEVPTSFIATRYHSLIIDANSLPNSLLSIAEENANIMALRHKTLPIYGLQFHPEAYLTEYGQQIINNFFEQN